MIIHMLLKPPLTSLHIKRIEPSALSSEPDFGLDVDNSAGTVLSSRRPAGIAVQFDSFFAGPADGVVDPVGGEAVWVGEAAILSEGVSM